MLNFALALVVSWFTNLLTPPLEGVMPNAFAFSEQMDCAVIKVACYLLV